MSVITIVFLCYLIILVAVAAWSSACQSHPVSETPALNGETLLATQGSAMQLRYLQTLTEIAGEKSSTIVFPLPMSLIEGFEHLIANKNQDT